MSVDRHAAEAAAASRYVLQREIGRGRRAVVFLAEDTMLQRRVAVKRARDASGGATLLEEGRRLARVASRRVVGVLDVDPGPPVSLVLEYLEGTTLRARMQSDRGWALARAAPLGVQLLEALRDVHAADLVHGDLKPENLWIEPDGGLRLIDLGAATRAAGDGTALYAAPEVDQGHAPTAASDLYGAAAVLYELLCGHPPFDATHAAELAVRKSTSGPPPVRGAGAVVPEAVETWLARALEPQPERRFASAVEALAAWNDAAGSTRGAAEPEPLADLVLHPDADAALDALLLRLRAGRGGCLVLEGERGIGCSTLLERWAERARRTDVLVIVVRRPLEAPVRPFAAWCAGVEAAAARLGAEAAGLQVEALRAAPESSHQSRIEGHLARLAAASPCVIVVDDFAACDPATRRLVLRLAARADRLGLSVAVGLETGSSEARPRRARAALVEVPAVRVALHAPTGETWRRFIAARLGTPSVSDALLAHVLAQAGDNPAAAAAVLGALQRCGALRFTGEAWVFRAERADAALPAEVLELAERRLRPLPAEVRRLLECAALQGTHFRVAPLAHQTGRDEADLVQQLHVLELETGLVQRAGSHWSFAQPLVAAALVARLAPELRGREHAALAAALIATGGDAEAGVGEHLFLAGRVEDALPYLERTARGALAAHDAGAALHALDLACRGADAALDSEARAARRVELALLRAQALQMLAAWDEALAELENAATLAQAWGLGAAEVRAARAQGEVEYARSRFDEAVRRFETAQACAARLGDEHELHELALKVGNIHFERGQLEQAAEQYERALDYATRTADLELEARAANNVGLVESIQGRKESAVQFFNRSLARFQALGRGDAVAWLYQNIGMIYLELANWAEARSYFARCMEQSETHGLDKMLAISCLDYAEATIRLGQPEAASGSIERALAICRERGDQLGIANAYRLQAMLAAAAGGSAEAEARLRQAIDLLTSLDQSLHLGLCWKELGAIRLATGDPRAAAAALREARRLFAALDAVQHGADVDALLARCREETPCRP